MLKPIFAVLFCLAALSGCKADYTGEGSIRAALAAAKGEPAAMTGIIAIEAGSESRCLSDAPALTEVLAKEYPGTTFLGCARHGYDTMAEFRVMLPVRQMKIGESAPAPLTMTAELNNTSVLIGLYMDGKAVNRVAASLPSNVTALFDGRFDMTVTLDIRNDTAATATVKTHGAFVDGQPAPFAVDHTLAPGQLLRVQPSDVHRAALGGGGTAFLFAVTPPQ